MTTIHGSFDGRFSGLVTELARQLERPRGGGASLAVFHRGQCVVDVWGGTKTLADDGSPALPWEKDTLAMSFSTTKGVLATLVHILVDRGELRYDDPIARVWPQFGVNGKERITLRHALSHRAGLFPMRSLVDQADRMLDWEYMTAAVAESRPAIEPGTRSAYHALTYGWLVGETVRRATSSELPALLDELIARPLGADGLFFGAPPAERHRVARLLPPKKTEGKARSWRSRARGQLMRGAFLLVGASEEFAKDALAPRGTPDLIYSDRILDAVIPALNGTFTARSLARMYGALAMGGAIGTTTLLSAEALRRATEVQGKGFDAVLGVPMAWRLGYHLVGTNRGVLPKGFGHFGWGGSGAWADPSRELSLALTLNRVAGTPVGDGRILRLGGIAASLADATTARP